ncbi:hypothetical protein FEM48_Zijuj08G0020100 [Ziziphus jujuba var. spinosa]|uniref:Germin-like protein n=1 Tax=Ziziphus jujuba var. spinosa TaxID=714518 RepID=A0A978UWC2_ZIZJJ|nr:hypothetical protein FEM48_Zijuj08G0020100 [Ziziphus jujuba var. spinosa]
MMKKMMISPVSFILSFLLIIFFSSHAAAQDFWPSDYSAPQGPAGYSSKKSGNIIVDDFVFSGLGVAGNTSNVFKAAVTPAFVQQFPGVNGLGVSLVRADIAPGGVIPLHAHPRATEIILLVEGTVVAGFISTANDPYIKTLKKGDIMVFPKGLLHFIVNSAPSNALIFASFSSDNPGAQILDNALFAKNFPSELIAASTLLDVAEVKRLKGVFGGSG